MCLVSATRDGNGTAVGRIRRMSWSRPLHLGYGFLTLASPDACWFHTAPAGVAAVRPRRPLKLLPPPDAHSRRHSHPGSVAAAFQHDTDPADGRVADLSCRPARHPMP